MALRENDLIRYDITQNITIRYDTMRRINATSNLTRFNTGVSSSMNVCCCCCGCEPGRYNRTTITAKQPTRARAQTISNMVGWSAMSIGDNAMSASTTMATPPWLTDRSSAVRGCAQSTTLYKRRHVSNWEQRCQHRARFSLDRADQEHGDDR